MFRVTALGTYLVNATTTKGAIADVSRVCAVCCVGRDIVIRFDIVIRLSVKPYAI